MDFIIYATIIVLVSGASTPFPQNPGVYLQVQPPIKPTKVTETSETNLSMEGFGPQKPSKEPKTVLAHVGEGSRDTSTVFAIKGINKKGNNDKKADVTASNTTQRQASPSVAPLISTTKFAPMKIETASAVTELNKNKLSDKVKTQTNGNNRANAITTGTQNQNAKTVDSLVDKTPVATKTNVATDSDKTHSNTPLQEPIIEEIVVKASNDDQSTNPQTTKIDIDGLAGTEGGSGKVILGTDGDGSFKSGDKLISMASGNKLALPTIDDGGKVNPSSTEWGEIVTKIDAGGKVIKTNDGVEKVVSTSRLYQESTANTKDIDLTLVDTQAKSFEAIQTDTADIKATMITKQMSDSSNVPVESIAVVNTNVGNSVSVQNDKAKTVETVSGIKNRDNVPTADELLKSGNTDPTLISKMQVKVDGKSQSLDSKPTGVKNKDNVPTADELLKSGKVDSNDISKMQVRIEDRLPNTVDLQLPGKTPISDTSVESTKSANEIPVVPEWVKHRNNVPTADELLKSGRVDPNDISKMQVRLEDPLPNTVDLQLPGKTPISDTSVESTKSTNEIPVVPEWVKHRNNVPTADELLKSGKVDPSVIPMLQVRVEDTPKKFDLKPTGIKNRDNVPTAVELLKSGKVDPNEISMMQVRIEDRLPNTVDLQIPGKTPISDTSADTTKSANEIPVLSAAKPEGEIVASGDSVIAQSLGEKVSALDVKENAATHDKASEKVKNSDKMTVQQKTETPSASPVSEQREATTLTLATKTLNTKPETTTKENTVTNTVKNIKDNTPANTSGSEKKTSTDTSGAKLSMDTSLEKNVTSVSMDIPVVAKTTATPVQMTTACPELSCSSDVKCPHGRKLDYRGCQTCTCKFSDACPPVLPVSRLLCLLQVRSSLSCVTDADCKTNRICCPGTCGAMCRRRSNRRRAMLLSILDGAL